MKSKNIVFVSFNSILQNDGDYVIHIPKGSVLDMPNIETHKDNYIFKGWKCINNSNFEFGVTSVTQYLEFDPIWEPI